jgi:hypothetical protein
VPSTGVRRRSGRLRWPLRPWRYGAMVDLGILPAGGFLFLVLGFFCVFFWMVRQRRYSKVRIRSFPPYPRFGGAPSASRGRVESCIQWIFSDLFSYHFISVFQVNLFRSMVVLFSDGCCSGALGLWDLSTTIFRLSTTTSSTTYDKFCPTPVMEGRGRRRAFGSR